MTDDASQSKNKLRPHQAPVLDTKGPLAPPPDLTGEIEKINEQYVAGGRFGDVYRCRYHDNSKIQEVAVKALRFRIDEDASHKSIKILRRELGIWRRLSHNNIVPFLGVAYGFGMHDAMSLVTEWMPNGCLHTFLQVHGGKLDTVHRLQILLDISKGLDYLHSCTPSIVHGDLNPNNVLLDADYRARLADFGCASLAGKIPEALGYLQRSTTLSGALRWIAPEQLDADESFRLSTESDIYSFGCVALQVLSGQQPWSEIRSDAAVIASLMKGQKPHKPESRTMDGSHWDFIQLCWSSPQDRPASGDLVISLEQFMKHYPSSVPLSELFISSSTSAQPTSLPENTVPAARNDLSDLTDLNKSILFCQEAVDVTPDGNLDKPAWLNNLGNALLTRFECCNNIEDIHKAISAQETAVQLATAQHREKSIWLTDLGRSLLCRFECLDDTDDLNRAISAQEEALQLIPNNHRNRSILLVDLGSSLCNRFNRLGDLKDLNQSIAIFEEAVHLVPDSRPDKPILLNKLGTLLFHRFERLGDSADVDKSASAFEHVLRLILDGGSNKLVSLDPNDVITSWARAMLIRRSLDQVLDSATKFMLPKFYTYRTICEILEGSDRVVESVQCFRRMHDEVTEDIDYPDEQAHWELNFRRRSIDKLKNLGDAAKNSNDYDSAIKYYMISLLLDQTTDIIIRICEARRALLIEKGASDNVAKTSKDPLLSAGKAPSKRTISRGFFKPDPSDFIIVLMGPTDSGKSNFINKLTGDAEARNARNLRSDTQAVVPHVIQGTSPRTVLVETPGFDDTYRLDTDILRVTAEWLTQKYTNGDTLKVAGIIYFHRITNKRMSGAVYKNLQMFGRICGNAPLSRTLLVTTMWDTLRDQGEVAAAEQRERELKNEFWAQLLSEGAQTRRFDNTGPSAWAIVQTLQNLEEEEYGELLLQEELVEQNKRLSETEAAKVLYSRFQLLLSEQKKTLKELADEAKMQNDSTLAKSLQEEYEKINVQLQKTFEEMEEMKIPFGRRIQLWLFGQKSRGQAVKFDRPSVSYYAFAAS